MRLSQHPMDQAHKRARQHHWVAGLRPRMLPRAILRGRHRLSVSSTGVGQKPVSEAHNPRVPGSSPTGPTIRKLFSSQTLHDLRNRGQD